MDRKQTSQVTTGAILIVIGMIFLLDRLDITHGLDIGKLWPVILLVIGFGQMFGPSEEPRRDSSGRPVVGGVQVGIIHTDGRRRSGDGIWLMSLGTIFLLNNFHIASVRQTWPLFIVIAGLAIMTGTRKSHEGPAPESREGER